VSNTPLSEDGLEDFKIGIALSGGGARAMAFHLGCLRCLHRLGILERARVMSTVSGGSVIGGLYAVHEGTFEEFETRLREVLRMGLVAPALKTAFTSWEGPKALAAFLLLVSGALFEFPLHVLAAIAAVAGRGQANDRILAGAARLRRFASRTTILERTLNRQLFAGARLGDTAKSGRPNWIAVATELRTGSAFYFGPKAVGSWRFGRVDPKSVTVAHAVTASAAFPLLLPALDEVLTFEKRDGTRAKERVTLTDGGIYDNLGLAPLWPDRNPEVSLAVEDIDTIIACRAGDGPSVGAPSRFLMSRMKASFAAMHTRSQNATMQRLFDLKAASKLRSFALAYLGQNDGLLTVAPPDLVSRGETENYPSDFSPMTEAWIERLSRRGDQLTLAVLRQHAPELIATIAD
jgi:NTE family protein